MSTGRTLSAALLFCTSMGIDVTEIRVRPAETSDQDVLAEIYLAARRQTFPWMAIEKFRHEDYFKATAGEKVLLAELSGALVGFVSVVTEKSFVHNLFIDPAYQAKGLGKALLGAGIENLPRPVRLKCTERNVQACKFYERLGWRAIETVAGHPDGAYVLYQLD